MKQDCVRPWSLHICLPACLPFDPVIFEIITILWLNMQPSDILKVRHDPGRRVQKDVNKTVPLAARRQDHLII